MEEYEYEITYVPSECTTYTLGQRVTKWKPTPPPPTIELESTGPCNGTTMRLVEE